MWENIVVFKLLSFHAYIEICQCENKCMIFFHRFTIPDVSIAVYIRCEAADKTNAFYLILLSADLMHLCFWNIQPSCIIITSVTQSGHVRYILYHKLLSFLFVRGYGGEAPLTKCQHGLMFSCSRKGPQLLFHVTSTTVYSKHSKRKKQNVPKNLY